MWCLPCKLLQPLRPDVTPYRVASSLARLALPSSLGTTLELSARKHERQRVRRSARLPRVPLLFVLCCLCASYTIATVPLLKPALPLLVLGVAKLRDIYRRKDTVSAVTLRPHSQSVPP